MSSNMPQHDPVPGADHAPATAVERSIGTDPTAGYERRDANIRTIILLAVSVVGTCALVFWGALALRDHFELLAKQNDPELSPLADVDQVPPAPHLQDTPMRDLAEFRDSQEHTLTSYAWINRQEGLVQIPVDRAMDLILERGLPAPTGPTEPQQQLDQQPPTGEEGTQPTAEAAPQESSSESSLNRQPPENR